MLIIWITVFNNMIKDKNEISSSFQWFCFFCKLSLKKSSHSEIQVINLTSFWKDAFVVNIKFALFTEWHRNDWM